MCRGGALRHPDRSAPRLGLRFAVGIGHRCQIKFWLMQIRALVRQHGAWANIPPKRNRTEALCFSPYLYKARNLVERFFNKIKHCRRVATRFDKLGANYLAFVQLASIRLWLRVNESTS